MKPGERVAVIDLGSNSFRLVVFMAGERWWKRTDEIYEPVRIGQGLAATGSLAQAPIERALATLDVFSHFCRASGLGEGSVDAVDRKSTRLNSSHANISYAVFCLNKKKSNTGFPEPTRLPLS